VYFHDLHGRLIDLAREKVRAGEVTERGLARMCGMSQPHMHNVLKGIRALSTSSADRLMSALGIHVADLLWGISAGGISPGGIYSRDVAGIVAVPMVRNRIGPGTAGMLTVSRGNIPMPGWLLKNLVEPVAAQLAPDLVMPAALSANDLVLLDQSPAVRAAPSGNGVWIVAEGSGLRARYLRLAGTRLLVGNEVTRSDPQQWLSIPLQGRNILEIVRAHIVWIGREMETEPAGPADPASHSD
jgi:hypothetical protein